MTGTAGAFGGTGTGGTTGAAGTGAAGTGAAGTGAAGMGAAGAAAGSTGQAGTTGAAGSAGVGGDPTTCAGCQISILYTCQDPNTDQATFIVEIKNVGPTILLLKPFVLRYWYTIDPTKEQELDCDTAQKFTCDYIVANNNQVMGHPNPTFVPVVPPRAMANEYVEIKIIQGAIDVGRSSGPIQLRLHNKDFTPRPQTNDYSADCAQPGQQHVDSGKITAYFNGKLIAGTEPQ
ncbi:MAG TPA: cellulose binding domain-containing protein [Polyangia bacterium]|nr:cellulose binding domain-containing protein [Polyangia bacterium]